MSAYWSTVGWTRSLLNQNADTEVEQPANSRQDESQLRLPKCLLNYTLATLV